jgi:hypothetical protein
MIDLGGEEVKKVLEEEQKGRDGTKVTRNKDDDDEDSESGKIKKRQ